MAKGEQKNWVKIIGVSLAASLLVGLIALAFLWPAKTMEPKNVPIAITGTSVQQVEAVKTALKTNAGDKIELITVENRDEAVNKMQHREIYGAIIISLPNPEILTASANGAALNAVITNVESGLEAGLTKMVVASVPAGIAAPAVTVRNTDVIPTHSATFDIAQLALPMVFGGMIGGVLIVTAVGGRLQRAGALVLYAFLAGNVLYLILQTWFNVLPAEYWAIVGAFSLGIFATSSFIVGSYVLAGGAGLGVAAAFTLLVANPISGLAIPTIFLTEPWGFIGQLLTVGAGGTLLRGAVYFPVAEVITTPLVVLTIWSLAGITATVIRNRKPLRGE